MDTGIPPEFWMFEAARIVPAEPWEACAKHHDNLTIRGTAPVSRADAPHLAAL